MANPERRRSPRKEVTLHASVERTDFGKTIAVQTENLSKRGAKFESPDQVLPEEVCIFKFVTPDARVVEVQGRIAWVERDDAGGYHAGVAFRNLSPDEEYLLELQMVRSAKK